MGTLNKRVIESLIKCGAFDSVGAKRSQMLAILSKAVQTAAQNQRDKASGQISLFGEETMNATAEIELPDIPEERQATLIAWEKEITGFYITGHPLDRYRSLMTNFFHIERILNGELRDGNLVRVGGLIKSAKRINTKKGDTMCFAEVEDYTRAIEVIVFPNLFLQKMELLEPDMPVVVEGRVDITDNGAKLIANQMWSLDEYKPDYFITIHGAKDTPENMTQLKNVFDKYHGEHVVYLFFVDKHKKIRTQPALWLNESPHVKEEIEKILGDGTVRQR